MWMFLTLNAFWLHRFDLNSHCQRCH